MNLWTDWQWAPELDFVQSNEIAMERREHLLPQRIRVENDDIIQFISYKPERQKSIFLNIICDLDKKQKIPLNTS